MNTLKTYFFFLVLILGLTITSCVDNEFDKPENTFSINADNVIPIADVLSLLDNSSTVVLGADNIGEETMYIKATINADDASGNFFKTISFQDETGALSIIPDRNELNAEFPIGHTLYVKLNGLTLTYDANLPRLGYGIEASRLQRIPDILVNEFMFAGGITDKVVPEVITLSSLMSNSSDYYNKLIQVDNVEFAIGFVGQKFADADHPDGPLTINAIITDCDGNEVILRNSGFADFANDIVPLQNGSLVAIASVFNDDLQLFIRDTDDIQFTEDRCDGSGGQATNEITIQSIQDRFYSLGVDKAEEGYIAGTVISDNNTGQVNFQNVYVQNGEDGILVRFSSEHSFDIGTQLKITVTGQEVSEFRGLLQINNVPIFNAVVTGSEALPAPREITISEILQNNNTYESTRVLIKGATLSGSSIFAGEVTVNDGTGDIVIFTYNETSYANDPVPSGIVDVTAIVSQYDETVQLVINGSSDISGGTVNPSDDRVTTGFESYSDGDAINKEGWMTVATAGSRVWSSTSHEGERFAECEAYQDSSPQTEAWLITPTIDTDDKSTFSFQSAQAYWEHQGLSVWISQDFTDIGDATWISLDQANLADNNDEFFLLVDSGEINLKDYLSGKVRVGFKYEGTAAANTTKMRIDNVVLK